MDFSFPGMAGGGMGAMPMIPKLTRGIMRRNVDYTSCVITYLENRIWQRGKRDRPIVQPDVAYVTKMVAPVGSAEDPVTAITTKFVKTVYNKQRCPIFCTSWAPDGRRLIAGAASGEFSLWNGVNLNFEALMKSHEASVRSMQWSHNGMWMATTDDRGMVKYWQSNMNNVHSFQAHSETIRGCSFSPTDAKLATCSDDGTVRVFDFLRSAEEFILRGHGADVKCVDWHPRKNLLVSGSKDNQQPVKLWDPKSGQSVSTIHAHKAAVTSVRWNQNGNWLLTASRDHLIKLYDIRTMKEMEVLKGHKSDVNIVSWHPVHEKLFTSGGSDGAILFWLVGNKRDIGGMESPHDSFVWSLAWHPLGHLLCSGSNDHTCKFWCRNRPGDEMKDRHTSGGLPVEEMADTDVFEGASLPQSSGNISLPPPAKNPGSVGLPPGAGKTTRTPGHKSMSVADKPPGNFPLQVLGADIIKEQFGDSGGPPGGPPGGQNEKPEPVKSGLFMHLQGGEGKEGRPPPPGDFGSPFQHSPEFHPSGGGLGSPDVRGSLQNFHAPRGPPPPMHQQRGGRREWGEGGPEFRPQFPPREFSSPHRHFRPNSQLASNPFSWQRQDPNRERAAFEDEAAGVGGGEGGGGGGMQRFHEGHNPYVYRREEGKLRDPREQRVAPPAGPPGGIGRVEEARRQSQDDGGPEWQNRGAPPPHVWQQRQEHHRGGPPPGHHRGPEFLNRESKPPTQEHFDQHPGPDFPPPHQQHRNVDDFPPMSHRMQDRPEMGVQNRPPFRDGENWRPQFRPERPPHEGGPPRHNFQGRPPPLQGPRFPHEEPRLLPRSEPHVPHSEREKGGPITPTGVVHPPGGMGGEERGGNVHDPRSQRPPTSQPLTFQPSDHQQSFPNIPPNQHPQTSQPPPFPPNDRQRFPDVPPNLVPPNKRPTTSQPLPFPPNDRQQRFPEVPPNRQDSTGHPNIHEGGPVRPAHPQSIREPPQHPQQQVRDVPMKPLEIQGPPNPHDGPPSRVPPPQQRHDGPPPPSQFRDGAPPHRNSPAHHPHMHDGPPNLQRLNRKGPPEVHDGAPPHRNSPAHHPPHMHDGPPNLQRLNREGPPEVHDGAPPHRNSPAHHPPHMHDGPPNLQRLNCEGPPEVHDAPPHHMLHDGPPLHVHEGPHPHNIAREGPHVSHNGPREGPPQHNIRDVPPHIPQQIRDGPPQHRNDVPPPHVHDGPPMNSPQNPNAPPHQHFDEFHGPQRGDRFFQNKQPGGSNSPRPGESPQSLSFISPHLRLGPPVNQGAPDEGPRFPGPPHMGQNEEHFHSPPHFPEPQGPPRPPQQHFPRPPHMDLMPREPHYNQFPPDQQHHPGLSDPRRPQQNFQPPERVPPNDRGFPPHHPVHHGLMQEGGPPPHRQDGGPPPHRQESGPPPHRQEGGPPPHRQEGGPPPHRQDGGPPPHRQEGGLPPHRQDGGPPPHRQDGGPPPHRQDGGPPPHRQEGGPPPHRQDGGPPPHRQDGGPPPHRQDSGPLQSGEPPNWNQRQQFPRDSGGRFEGNRDPSSRGGERRSSGGSSRGEGRGDKREREREREREGRGSRGPRDRSPKHHSSSLSSRDGQPPTKRSRSDRDFSSKHSSNRSREKSSRK